MRVLVIGGGVVGLTIAREFAGRGEIDVVLLEKGKLGRESSFAAAGMLAPQAEADTNDQFFKFCSLARDFYPGFASEIESETAVGIELDRSGTIYTAFEEEDEFELSNRYGWQKDAGLQVEKLSARETHKLEPFVSPDSIGSLYFPNDWQVENRKLLRALIAATIKNEIEVHEDTEILTLAAKGGKVCGVVTECGKTVEGDVVILATGAWTSLIEVSQEMAWLPTVKPVRGQMIGYKTAKRLISRVIYSRRGYVVPRMDGRILAGATTEDAGFENTVTNSGIEKLKRTAMEIVPSLSNLDICESWAGLRPRAEDNLPLIGAVGGPENLYLSTGHYRNGILLAPYSAKILAELILEKRESSFLQTFSPNRLKNRAGV